jgi:hypothetical protein
MGIAEEQAGESIRSVEGRPRRREEASPPVVAPRSVWTVGRDLAHVSRCRQGFHASSPDERRAEKVLASFIGCIIDHQISRR